eukprot:366111-Chlamydomonas_euryale.AAC.6
MPCMGVGHCTRGVEICCGCPVVQGHRPLRRGGGGAYKGTSLLSIAEATVLQIMDDRTSHHGPHHHNGCCLGTTLPLDTHTHMNAPISCMLLPTHPPNPSISPRISLFKRHVQHQRTSIASKASNAKATFHPSNAKANFHPRNAKATFNPRKSKATFNPRNAKATFNPRNAKATFDPSNAKATFNPSNAKATFNPPPPHAPPAPQPVSPAGSDTQHCPVQAQTLHCLATQRLQTPAAPQLPHTPRPQPAAEPACSTRSPRAGGRLLAAAPHKPEGRG